MSKSKFLAVSSILNSGDVGTFFCAAGDQAGDAAAAEQVIVTASRISIAGYEQPTPVTVLGTARLEQASNPDIGNIIQAGIRFNC